MKNAIVSLMFLLLALHTSFAGDRKKETAFAPAAEPVKAAILNVNRLSSWYDADGQMERNPFNGNSGVTYPFGTSTAIYASGMMLGGYVTDGLSTVPRVTGFSYNKGFVSGAINGIRTGNTDDPADSLNRIYRIRHDYATVDLKREVSEQLSAGITIIGDLTDAPIRAQYRKDWAEWPAAKGAPFYDADHDGKYTPQFRLENGVEVPVLFPEADEPGIAGADQVIYYVSNDVRPVQSPWKSPAIGIELQTTIWGYDAAANTGNGNAIYKRTRMIYKGTAVTPDTAKLREFYIGQWSDPDLGDAGDDFVGCDSVVGSGYVYNSKTLDAEYHKYGISPPAVGYILLQGPVVGGTSQEFARFDMSWRKGFRNLGMTSFQFTVPILAPDPIPFNPNGAYIWYQVLRGLPPMPQGPPDPGPMIDPVTKKPTMFWASGDPVSKTGWIDGMVDYPGDRRMVLSSGPFTMSLGDTQEVVYALVGGLGSDRLASVSVMKYFMRDVRQFYSFLYPDDPTAVADRDKNIATQFHLDQNYPNPFNPATTIGFTLPLAGPVRLSVFDALGREVAVLANGVMSAGSHSVQWNAYSAPSGLYFYRLSADGRSIAKRMILLK